jgi:membrane protease YdiL (CAAX protease family)
VLMLAFVVLARWNYVWRDPQKLVASTVMKVAMGMWCVAIAVRLTGIEWSRVPHDLLLAIVLSGLLVGFAEEILFRGIVLRGMREGGRPESLAAIWTAACFGLFHLPNMFMGVGLLGLSQVVLAALSGIILYAFRRHYGMIWPAMVAHGAWDISLFLAGRYGAPWLAVPASIMQLVIVVLGIAVLVSIYQNDRRLVAI